VGMSMTWKIDHDGGRESGVSHVTSDVGFITPIMHLKFECVFFLVHLTRLLKKGD